MKKLKPTLILTLILTITLLTGCGQSFDASGHTKAVVDAMYKNDSTAFVAMEIGTAEEASQLYENYLNGTINAMLESVELTAEQQKTYRELFANILAEAKYTVGEAEKQDDGSYIVTIHYEQMNVYESAITNYMAKIEALTLDWTAAAMAGELTVTEEEMMNTIIMALKDCLEESLANATYDAPATTTVRIELINNVYTPNNTDFLNLEMVFFDLENAMEFIQ